MTFRPYLFIIVFFSLYVLFSSWILRLLEAPYYNALPPDNSKHRLFDSYFNVVWLVIITLTTVGYGDIAAVTLPGRLLTIFVAISSLFIVA